MMNNDGKRQATAYLDAIQLLINPHHAVLAATSPLAVIGSGHQVDVVTLAAMAQAADRVDADLLYVEFEPGFEMEGPRNVVALLPRHGICHIKSECRFWLSEDDRIFLVPRKGSGRISFDADGMDYMPRTFKGGLEAGFARAAARLQARAAEILRPGNEPARERIAA